MGIVGKSHLTQNPKTWVILLYAKIIQNGQELHTAGPPIVAKWILPKKDTV